MPVKRASERFSLKQRAKSFQYAINGLKILFATEHNARIHAIVASIVILTGLLLGLSATEWLFIALAITLVMVTELLNTALEYLADYSSPTHNELIGRSKDLSAAAVLVSSTILSDHRTNNPSPKVNSAFLGIIYSYLRLTCPVFIKYFRFSKTISQNYLFTNQLRCNFHSEF